MKKIFVLLLTFVLIFVNIGCENEPIKTPSEETSTTNLYGEEIYQLYGSTFYAMDYEIHILNINGIPQKAITLPKGIKLTQEQIKIYVENDNAYVVEYSIRKDNEIVYSSFVEIKKEHPDFKILGFMDYVYKGPDYTTAVGCFEDDFIKYWSEEEKEFSLFKVVEPFKSIAEGKLLLDEYRNNLTPTG